MAENGAPSLQWLFAEDKFLASVSDLLTTAPFPLKKDINRQLNLIN